MDIFEGKKLFLEWLSESNFDVADIEKFAYGSIDIDIHFGGDYLVKKDGIDTVTFEWGKVDIHNFFIGDEIEMIIPIDDGPQ